MILFANPFTMGGSDTHSLWEGLMIHYVSVFTTTSEDEY